MEKKTLIIGGGVIIGVLILLLVFVWLLSILKPHYYSYFEAEELISKATNKYFKEHADQLPVQDGKTPFYYDTLVEGKYIKPLNKVLKDGDNCGVDIFVDKSGNNYDYITKLNCGENYQTREFYAQVLQDQDVVTVGSGLYADANGKGYYFRGKIDNNYVIFGSKKVRKETINLVWRIMGIDENNNVKLRATFPTDSVKWDDRYNQEKGGYTGYNNFEESVMKDYLRNLESDNSILDEILVNKLVAKPLCVGERSKTDATTDGSVECALMSTENYKFGTITPYEYMRASLDENCNSLNNRSCSNFNYLSEYLEKAEWTLTPVVDTTEQLYVFSGRSFQTDTARDKHPIYLTINLGPYVYYRSGNGTASDPYIIR